MIPAERRKSVTFKQNGRSRSTGMTGHVPAEQSVIFRRIRASDDYQRRCPRTTRIDVASKQAVVELVWATCEEANVLDIRMFGIQENICVGLAVNRGYAQGERTSGVEPLVTDGL